MKKLLHLSFHGNSYQSLKKFPRGVQIFSLLHPEEWVIFYPLFDSQCFLLYNHLKNFEFWVNNELFENDSWQPLPPLPVVFVAQSTSPVLTFLRTKFPLFSSISLKQPLDEIKKLPSKSSSPCFNLLAKRAKTKTLGFSMLL